MPGTNVSTIRSCRILVADDHRGVSAAIRRLLMADNYEVVGTVEDGALVLDEATRLQPNVILLDLHMPNMNGIDICRELTRRLSRMKTIVVTGEGTVFRPAALAAGAFAFVEKLELHTALLPAVKLACKESATSLAAAIR